MRIRHAMTIVLLGLGSGLVAATHAQERLGDVEYEKLGTRAATEDRMIQKLLDRPEVEWGDWYMLGPFPGSDQGMLADPRSPEEELDEMGLNGPGPDLAREHTSKAGAGIEWRNIGRAENRAINLAVYGSGALDTNSTAYLYRTVTVPRDVSLPITTGSDDGLRFWLNGTLLIDADVPRGLDPEAHRLDLPLRAGVNHILCKVTQGGGGWQYALGTLTVLDPQHDAKLQRLLDRDFPKPEDAHYPKATIPIPEQIVLEVGGLDTMPDGRAVVCTRRGDVFLVDWSDDEAPFDASYTLFASGLHEPLGLEVREEEGQVAVYCVQRAELTRMVDEDGDDRADLYETVTDAWGVSGNYHEFAFGPKFDADGNAWVTLNVGFCGSLGKSVVPYRGWALKVTPEGELIPVCDGLRSPNGIGFLPDGAPFYVDNQGDYVGTCKMSLLAEDSWHGHPSTLRWREGLAGFGSSPQRQRPAVWFPYRKMGQSTADIATAPDTFGPFGGQLFCGDQTDAEVLRVFLERVKGVYQGACFPFRENLDCGVNRIAFDGKSGMLVGQTDRGWGSIGRKRYGLQRVWLSDEPAFEILRMRAAPDGFVLEFTHDIDPDTAGDPDSYSVVSYTYEYHRPYGSDEMETETLDVRDVNLLSDRAAHVVIDGLRSGGEGFVHEFHVPGVRNAEGEPLLHDRAYYTLQVVPDDMPDVGDL